MDQRPTPNEEGAGRTVYDLEERLLDYAARIIRLCDALPSTRAANHIAGQLLRSGTSPLPNHGEAEAAESRDDFIHKFKICLKELRESRRWLRLLGRCRLIKPASKLDPLIAETEELICIFFTSIRTAASACTGTSRVAEDPPGETPWALDVGRWTLGVDSEKRDQRSTSNVQRPTPKHPRRSR